MVAFDRFYGTIISALIQCSKDSQSLIEFICLSFFDFRSFFDFDRFTHFKQQQELVINRLSIGSYQKTEIGL